MTGIGRRALLQGGGAMAVPGLGRPAPSRPPYPGHPESAASGRRTSVDPNGDIKVRNASGAVLFWFSNAKNAQFYYADTGSAAQGALTQSIAVAKGADPFGNAYVGGTCLYKALQPSGVQCLQVTFGGMNLLTAPGYGGPYGDTSGTIAFSKETFGAVTGIFGDVVDIRGPLAEPLIAVQPGTDATKETWHPVTLASANGWAVNASYHVPQYRLLPDGNVQFSGLASRAPFTTTIALNPAHPLPDAYRPSKIKAVCQGSAIGNRARVEVHSDGVLYAVGTSLFRVTTAEIEGVVSST